MGYGRTVNLIAQSETEIKKSIEDITSQPVTGRGNSIKAYELPQASLFQPMVCFKESLTGLYHSFSLLEGGKAMLSPNQWSYSNIDLLIKNARFIIEQNLPDGGQPGKAVSQAGMSANKRSFRFEYEQVFELEMAWNKELDKWICDLVLRDSETGSGTVTLRDSVGTLLFESPLSDLPRAFTLLESQVIRDDTGDIDQMRLYIDDGQSNE